MAAIAFALYYTTLLPGQDLGDTASFQTISGEPVVTPRQGYPLYLRVTGWFVHALPSEPARATNLASATEAAVAVGLLVLVGAEVGGTLLCGVAAAAFLAGSYTFWSQAIIAEVYALHLLMVGATLLALLAWLRRPTLLRLSVFFALYAAGFGNHLSMVLLLPAYTVFLLAAPGGPRAMLRPRVVLLAVAIASACALQYWWNFKFLLAEPDHPPLAELLSTFWFDVTKTDWRATMVYGIPWSLLADRWAMYAFDLRQQFGVPGVALSVVGIGVLLRRNWRFGLLLSLAWVVNWAFAFTYNVGDTHVFYLPSHLFVALAAGCGVGWVGTWATGLTARATDTPDTRRVYLDLAAAALLLAYPAWRAYDTYPAMDRSADSDPTRFFDGLVKGLDGRREILGSDMNWQLHNGLDYYSKYTRPDLVVFDLPDTLLYLPILAQDNFAMGRTIALTEGAAAMVRTAYGDRFQLERDDRAPVRPLGERVADLPHGTCYVLCVMDSYPETPLDPVDLAETARRLGLGPDGLPRGRFVVVAGRIGEPPVQRVAGDQPFRTRVDLDGHAVDVRIECWLPEDTIRRAGFGHVIVDRRHLLTIDRGASFVAFGVDGSPVRTEWAGGLYAPPRRFVIRPPAR
jgi:hypothetical protein